MDKKFQLHSRNQQFWPLDNSLPDSWRKSLSWRKCPKMFLTNGTLVRWSSPKDTHWVRLGSIIGISLPMVLWGGNWPWKWTLLSTLRFHDWDMSVMGHPLPRYIYKLIKHITILINKFTWVKDSHSLHYYQIRLIKNIFSSKQDRQSLQKKSFVKSVR